MDETIRQYMAYSDLIVHLTRERNQKLREVLHGMIISSKDKACTKPKATIEKFKGGIKDIDLKAKDIATGTSLIVNNFINRIIEFKNKVVNTFKRETDKIKTVPKDTIDKLKSQMLYIARILYDEVSKSVIPVYHTNTSNFKLGAMAHKVSLSKEKVMDTSKEKIAKFKNKEHNYFVDLEIKRVGLKAKENVLNVEVKMIDKYQKFKTNITQFSNASKNKVGTFKKETKARFAAIFKSDDVTRNAKKEDISKRQQKIAELKEYRKQLLRNNSAELESTGRSRGYLYSLTAIIMGIISIISTIITIILIKK